MTTLYFLEHTGVASFDLLVGCNDYDFSPPHIARQFIVDDQKVMASTYGTDRLEMNIS